GDVRLEGDVEAVLPRVHGAVQGHDRPQVAGPQIGAQGHRRGAGGRRLKGHCEILLEDALPPSPRPPDPAPCDSCLYPAALSLPAPARRRARPTPRRGRTPPGPPGRANRPCPEPPGRSPPPVRPVAW